MVECQCFENGYFCGLERPESMMSNQALEPDGFNDTTVYEVMAFHGLIFEGKNEVIL
jgi:hypothetical protein